MPEILYTITVRFDGKKAETTRNLTNAKATELERKALKSGAAVVQVFQQK